ncbi:MAG: hypothetical protein IJK42_11755 [Prevotella sp.]|nr:hypothetical protein [Prevotella sp.]
MMNFRLLRKKMMMALAVLFCSVVTANAANITYQLKTHVDGRTITGTANLASGAALEANMPKDLWRAFCTYKYYADENLTEEISEAPAENATVYVDYEFDPPFIMSEEGGEATWNYLRSYNSSGTERYYVYYNQVAENEYARQVIKASKTVPSVGNLGTQVSKKGHREWAFYGDAYDFNIRVNDETLNNQWLVWSSTTRNEAPIRLGTKPELGWQLYVNTATNSKFGSGMVALGVPNTAKYLASLQNVSYYVDTETPNSDYWLNDKNELVSNNYYKRNLWWYAFFATPVTENSTITDIWHVTYKILQADGTWYQDIVKQKNSSNLAPAFPDEYVQKEGCTYDYFYKDANFTDKCEEGYTMPADRNTVLYIKEVAAPVEQNVVITRDLTAGRWVTLVLPYDVKDMNNLPGGIKGEALEYVSLNVDRESYWSEAHLVFKTVNEMKANYPYLFRAVEFADGADYGTLTVYEGPESGKPVEADLISVNHDDNLINVEMKGTYDGKTLDVAPYSEPKGYKYIYFYFGYDPQAEVPYNFYVVDNGTVQINPYLCYFNVTYIGSKDEDTGAKGVRLTFSQDVTGINQVSTVAESNDGKVYNLNGQQVSGSLTKGIYIVNGKKVLVK